MGLLDIFMEFVYNLIINTFVFIIIIIFVMICVCIIYQKLLGKKVKADQLMKLDFCNM